MNRKLLVALMSGALVLPMAAQGVEIAASGHLNRALVFHDMEDDAIDPVHTDGGSSPSRFRFTGTEDMDNGVTAGVNLEYGAGGNAGDNPGIRHAAVSLGGDFGTLTVGQSAPATHLIGHVGYDNTAWLSGTELGCDFCLAGGATFGGAAYAYGASRRQMVKFETPSLGFGTVSVSADGNDFWDAALRVSGEAGALGYQLQVGFTSYAEVAAVATAESRQTVLGSDLNEVLDSEELANTGAGVKEHLDGTETVLIDPTGVQLADGSPVAGTTYYTKFTPMDPGMPTPETEVATVAAAVSFGQGSHLDVAWLSADPDGGDSAEMSHFRIGHNIGDTSIAATFTNSDFGGGGESWGLGVGHALGEVQLYAGYKALEFDTTGAEDFSMFIVGSRIMFN